MAPEDLRIAHRNFCMDCVMSNQDPSIATFELAGGSPNLFIILETLVHPTCAWWVNLRSKTVVTMEGYILDQ